MGSNPIGDAIFILNLCLDDKKRRLWGGGKPFQQERVERRTVHAGITQKKPEPKHGVQRRLHVIAALLLQVEFAKAGKSHDSQSTVFFC